MTYILVCYCGNEIRLKRPYTVVRCFRCGRKYIYKRRSHKYVFASWG